MQLEARFNMLHGSFRIEVDLNFPSQGITALFGPSGCGKTSVLRAIAGLDFHPDGFLKFGKTIWQDSKHFLPTHQRPLGYVFQEASLLSHLSVSRNLEYGYRRVPAEKRKVSMEQAVELLGISSLLKRKSSSLSGGERQRVAIARALAVSPDLLLMDEPLAALDAESKQGILPYLESLHQELKIPVVYVSHSLEEIARIADYLILLESGNAVASGPIHAMLTRLDLSLAQSPEAAAVVDAVGVGFEEDYHLTHLDFVGGRFMVPGRVLEKGKRVRVKVSARDVSLTLEHQKSTSIQNIFAAQVEEIQAQGDAQVVVRLDVGGAPMLARITQKSAAELALVPGKKVFAQVKSVGLLH